MRHVIVDTNVPLKAANKNPEDDIDQKCSMACLTFISKLVNSKDVIVLDNEREILKEYAKKIDTHAEDNVASVFLNWVYRCIRLDSADQYKITKTGKNTYAEFPNSPELEEFDPSDRKFVALAKAHPLHPPIHNGSDTDWWDYKDALAKEGVSIVFLCKEYMIAKCK